ncbi:MAG: flagellar basal body P-ring protein FlgI [Planctomycetota bacterium]|jgi:flagellar basal body P-ring protein FlgI
MSVRCIKAVSVTAVLAVTCFTFGCGELGSESREIKKLGATIGSLVEVVSPDLVAVEGYGIVGGLRGSGSGDCPSRVRTYLKQYILKHFSEHRWDVDKFMNSSDTAVVRVYGVMSTAVLESRHFDVQVAALPGTQTTSLEGGWLYSTELKQVGRFGLTTRILGMAEGPVFIDTIEASVTDKRVGYALSGGTVFGEYPIGLVLRRPDFRNANIIRNRLNERYGPGTAKAVNASQIILNVPAKYGKQKQRFISIIKAMYLAETEEATNERIKTFVGKLAVSEDKEASEIALEAIGIKSLSNLVTLLNSGYEEVRLGAGRCMLNLGSDTGLETLKTIAMDKDSAYRVESLEAITAGANRNDAAAISRLLLRDEEFSIRLAAYEQLRKIDDIAIIRRPIARSFYLEQITQTQYKTIFVSRSGQARIVLFGAPIICRDNMFVQSANGEITIDSRAGQQYVSLTRKHPTRPTMIGPLRCSLELGDVIQTLCDEPVRRSENARIGLGVSYADVIALLKQMCEKGAVEAKFEAGPLPKIK